MDELGRGLTPFWGTIFLLRLIALIAGALQVSFYHVWEFNYRGFVTVMGWITLVGASLRLIFLDSNKTDESRKTSIE